MNGHYRTSHIQALSVIDDWGLDFTTGNVLKYIQRMPHKGTPNADSIKALWYLAFAVTRDVDFADRIAQEAEAVNGKSS